MKDFRKLSAPANSAKGSYFKEPDLANDSSKKDNSPLSNALFLHFQKWNPELLDNGLGNQGELNEGAGRG